MFDTVSPQQRDRETTMGKKVQTTATIGSHFLNASIAAMALGIVVMGMDKETNTTAQAKPVQTAQHFNHN